VTSERVAFPQEIDLIGDPYLAQQGRLCAGVESGANGISGAGGKEVEGEKVCCVVRSQFLLNRSMHGGRNWRIELAVKREVVFTNPVAS
jgi:hypothetical protein